MLRVNSSNNLNILTILDQVILFVSDGDPQESEEDILNIISAENAKLGNKVIIQTFGFGIQNGIDKTLLPRNNFHYFM